jgi:hypothetical protein
VITEFDIDEFENGLFGRRTRDTSTVMTSARRPVAPEQRRPRATPIFGVIRRQFKDGTSIEEIFLTDRALHSQVFASCGCVSARRLTRRFRTPSELRTYLFDAMGAEAQRVHKVSSLSAGVCDEHQRIGARRMTRFDTLTLVDQYLRHESIALSVRRVSPEPQVTTILRRTFSDGAVVEQGLTADCALYQRRVLPCGCIHRWQHKRNFETREHLQEFLTQLRNAGHERLLRPSSGRAISCRTHKKSAS